MAKRKIIRIEVTYLESDDEAPQKILAAYAFSEEELEGIRSSDSLAAMISRRMSHQLQRWFDSIDWA